MNLIQEKLDRVLREKITKRQLEQMDLLIVTIDNLPKEITKELEPIISKLIEDNNEIIIKSFTEITKEMINAIKEIKVEAPVIPEIKIPDVVIPEIKVPTIVIPELKMPTYPEIKIPETKLDMSETHKLMKDIVKEIKNSSVELEII